MSRCGRRWWRYVTPDGRALEGGSAPNDEALFAQAIKQIPKRLKELESADAKRTAWREAIEQRLGGVDTPDAKAIRNLLRPSSYEFDDFETGFINSIVVTIKALKVLSPKQQAVIREMAEKVVRGF